MADTTDDALVLRPTDSAARTGAWVFAAIALIGLVGLIVEIATGNVIGAVAAAIVGVAGVLLALVVVAGRSGMRVVVDQQSLRIASRRIPRSDIAGLRRRVGRDAGLDVVGRDDAVLYSMPGWFDGEQEKQLAAALRVGIEEPPPEPEAVEETSA